MSFQHEISKKNSNKMCNVVIKKLKYADEACDSPENRAKQVLLCFSDASLLYTTGAYNMTLIFGRAVLNGGVLTEGCTIKAYSPLWDPAQRLEVSASVQKKPRKVSKIEASVRQLGFTIIPNNQKEEDIWAELAQYACVILYGGLDEREMEWMVQAEGLHTVLRDTRFEKLDFTSVGSSVCGQVAQFTALQHMGGGTLPLSTLTLSESWRKTVEDVAKRRHASITHTPPKIVVCGAKGSGKSTLVRYQLNHLLRSYPVVALIDCDMGQCELSPPGTVSLHMVKAPLLEPSYLVMSPPELSFFTGDTSAKQDPGRVLAAISALYNRYGKLQAAADREADREMKANVEENMFRVFDNTAEQKARHTIPLLVNTDGWIRYTGGEILAAIVRLVQPSDIFHIVTDKDKTLDALAVLPAGCKKHDLSPGSRSPSRVNPSDSRLLRVISYFLRKSSVLSELAMSASLPVSIKNGSIQDASGAISYAMARSTMASMPFSLLSLGTLGPAVSIQNLRLAFNCSIVGICSLPTEEEHSTRHSSSDSDITVFKPKRSTDGGDIMVECHGLGIVRYIDDDKREIGIHAPTLLRQKLSHTEKILLLKGYLQLPLSFTFAPWASSHPFSSGEALGEGGAVMRSRVNLKRRSQA